MNLIAVNCFNTLRPGQESCDLEENISKGIFINDKFCIQVMSWCPTGAKPLPEKYWPISLMPCAVTYWNRTVIILTTFSLLPALEVIIFITSNAIGDKNFIKIAPCPFQCWATINKFSQNAWFGKCMHAWHICTYTCTRRSLNEMSFVTSVCLQLSCCSHMLMCFKLYALLQQYEAFLAFENKGHGIWSIHEQWAVSH